MAKKKILVSDILDLLDDGTKINCSFTAYGVSYADSWNDGMRTVADCKDRLRHECLNAHLTGVGYSVTSDPSVSTGIITCIYGELVH